MTSVLSLFGSVDWILVLARLDSVLVTGALEGRGTLMVGDASSVMPSATLRLALVLALIITCTC